MRRRSTFLGIAGIALPPVIYAMTAVLDERIGPVGAAPIQLVYFVAMAPGMLFPFHGMGTVAAVSMFWGAVGYSVGRALERE